MPWYSLVKHLALTAQSITLLHQAVDLLSSLQYTFNSLMQHNLRLIQLLLDLQDTVRLLWVLVLVDVFLELWKREWGRIRACEGGARIAGEKLVEDFG